MSGERGRALATVALLGLGGMFAPATAVADPPSYQRSCNPVMVGVVKTTVDIMSGKVGCTSARSTIRRFAASKPRAKRTTSVTVSGIRWSCTYSRDAANNKNGSAWRYICSAKNYRWWVAGHRLLEDRAYLKEGRAMARAASVAGWVGSAGETRMKPQRMSFDLGRRESFPGYALSAIKWSAWGGEHAAGSGRLGYDASQTRRYGPIDAQVKLGGVRDCAGVLVYTRAEFSGEVGVAEPSWWSGAPRVVTARCEVLPRTCEGGRSRCTEAIADLAYGIGRPYGKGALNQVRWRGWNSERAVGVGEFRSVMPIGEPFVDRPRHAVYALRIEVSRPRWCRSGIAYTRLRVAAYGSAVRYDWHRHGRSGRLPAEIRRQLSQRVRNGRLIHRTTVNKANC